MDSVLNVGYEDGLLIGRRRIINSIKRLKISESLRLTLIESISEKHAKESFHAYFESMVKMYNLNIFLCVIGIVLLFIGVVIIWFNGV